MAVTEHAVLRRPGFFVFILGATVVAWMIFYVGLLPGHTFNATRFILYDQGSFLYAIARMEAGEKLYSEFAWQYGPLALGWYRAFATLGGNTPLSLVLASGVAAGAAWMLLVFLAMRKVGGFVDGSEELFYCCLS